MYKMHAIRFLLAQHTFNYSHVSAGRAFSVSYLRSSTQVYIGTKVFKEIPDRSYAICLKTISLI
jgi:hypothetical protein